MKKSVITLVLVFVFAIAGTTLAAVNPFSDVPSKHWSYAAVTKLSQAGIVDGYADGTFGGDKTISRYEMAMIVARAVANADKADAINKALIEKLTAEYASELDKLGARVTNLENKVDRFQMNGTVRLRYDHEKINDIANDGVDRHINLELVATAHLNDGWDAVAKMEGNKKIFGTASTKDSDFDLKKLYVTGPLAGTQVMLGKFGWVPNYGITWDNDSTGANITFGKSVKTTLFAGKPEDRKNITAYGASFTYAATPKTNVGLLVYGTDSSNSALDANSYTIDKIGIVTDEAKRTIYEVGFDTKLNSEFKLTSAYAKSNADERNTNYKIQLDYKGADSTRENSFGAYVKYAKCEAASAIKPGGDIDPNQKGTQVGFDYVPMKNSKLSLWYFDKKFITTDISDTKYRAQMEFYF